ncbi:hypothetical protein Q0590_25115 [Rhodocytophaga aerolata]|uniref:DUF4178 domain-containing protein n=1 Tax=Rhodocytophaga aerolata TaxID=455078 RepID=A0ABT8RBU3_9BACT|nr:hypothetical protein [Rhodocytophaga aerolata]MDO1449582.1 hypothetical protein [Rhodocytophaga aerolata]
MIKFKSILVTLKKKGFKVLERPYELNIVGVRAATILSNAFDDTMWVFYREQNGKWRYKQYRITTDPGKYYLEKGFNGNATSILAQGQYVDAYSIGLHQGKYEALVQTGKVTALLDDDKNNVLNFNSAKTKTGLFGINIHRAAASGTTEEINNYSAACQVFANAQQFKEFLELCRKHKDKYGNKFTYTLIDEKTTARQQTKRIVASVFLLALVLIVLVVLYRKGVLSAWLTKLKSLQPKIQIN